MLLVQVVVLVVKVVVLVLAVMVVVGVVTSKRCRRTEELCARWAGLSLDIDEILEAPLDSALQVLGFL